MNDLEEWERVHTVKEFWDRPRRGFADYGGRPHTYSCLFDERADDWSGIYLLSPVSEMQLAIAKEHYEIFERWLAAHSRGLLAPADKHPALAIDRPRREELGPLVDEALAFDESGAVRATAEFKGSLAPLDLKVCWRNA
jgi:hypothetical protein